MYSLIARGLALLFVALAGGVVLLIEGARAYPVFFFGVAPAVLFFWWLGRRERLKREAAAHDLRMQDAHVPSMSPREYEQFVARQLERAGWKVLHCGRPGDQGCDVLGELRGFKVVCQTKLYRVRVGNDAVQQVVATRRHYGAQIMVVVAPNGFTRSAEQLAASNGVHLMHHSALHSLENAARIP